MGGVERFFYCLNILLTTVPLAVLRYFPFQKEMRIPLRIFWGIYAALIGAELFYMNWVAWPEAISFAARQRAYLVFMVFISLLFFSCIRHFWQQLFVFCILALYGVAIFYLPPMLGNQYLLWLPKYSLSCLVMFLEYVLTWRRMKRFLMEDFQPFYLYGTHTFWRVAWILPCTFFVIELIFSVEQTEGDQMRLPTLFNCYLGWIGLMAGIRTMLHCTNSLQGNRVLSENIDDAKSLYQLQLDKCQALAAGFRKARQLRHDLRHFAMELERHVELQDWAALGEDLQRYEQRLTGESKEPDSGVKP